METRISKMSRVQDKGKRQEAIEKAHKKRIINSYYGAFSSSEFVFPDINKLYKDLLGMSDKEIEENNKLK